MKSIYIAGPMRGFEYYNFPAFDAARVVLEYDGWRVVSPADMDRARGHDPTTFPADHDWDSCSADDLDSANQADLTAILECAAIFMLAGWENSEGARAEHALAQWAGKEVLFEEDPTPPSTHSLPTDAAARKAIPLVTGCLHYFPDALAEVAKLSKAGNDQHNPGQPLHWDRAKSADHVDCLGRHLLQIDERDTDGQLHATKVAWRALAHLQGMLEQGA